MIGLDGLEVRVGGFTLGPIDFAVPTGGYALIIGPSGSGKTTLLESIAGHVAPRRGRIRLRGDDVTDWPPEARRIGFVYQQYHLFPHRTVRDNIGYGLERSVVAPPERAGRVHTLAQMLGIDHLLDRGVGRLSGGEQQRVALARALAPRPTILLLDEPFAAVDPATRQVLRRELQAIHEQEGTTTLQVTHDFDDALRMGDVVAVLSEGRVVQQGSPETVFRQPNSPYVARFIGTGNVIAGRVERMPDRGAGGEGGAFAARFQAGPLEFEVVAEREGPAHAVIRPEDILLSRNPLPGSARNRLAAIVARLERSGPIVHVYLDVGRTLVAVITAAAAEELTLRPGDQVALAFKATAVHLI